MGKLKFALIGNCQTAPIRKLLMGVEDIYKNYESVYFPPIQNWTKDDVAKFEKTHEELELIIAQPITNRIYKFVSLDRLKSISSNKKLILFPSIYFTGYFPNAVRMEKVDIEEKKVATAQCGLVLCLYMQSKTWREVYKIYKKVIRDKNEIYVKEFNETMRTMIWRENKFKIDIKLSDFFHENCRSMKLMHSFNHPSNVTLYYTVNKILDELGINGNRNLYEDKEFFGNITFPVSAGIRDSLGLSFRDDFAFIVRAKKYGIKGYIKLLYNYYDENPRIARFNYILHKDKMKSLLSL